ncbi:PotD/PotF family extracellular solute-binding protein [Legionella sp. W05-934-2]|uniref:ABC transporter substrate-binding protein n=1 Tax=Legionella sp. W05-934-2 TaxID=1198649 RepID=UPI003461C9AE
MKKLLQILCFIFLMPAHANKVVNVYAWGGEIPASVIRAFEQKTNIQVNFSTYDNNETLYAKLKAGGIGTYDVIVPSAYYVERMKRQGMLHPLAHKKIPNYANLTSPFTKLTYDKGNHYSMPLIWGITGMFYPKHIANPPKRWKDFWQPRWKHQLVLLDDAREVFSMALLAKGYSANDSDPTHVEQAFQALLQLRPNIKLFASDNIQAIIIDEDAQAGMAWNGDVGKALAENAPIAFQFPEDGFVMWVDSLAIPKNAPHLEEAYAFINFLLAPESGASIALEGGHAITNEKAKALLPNAIRNNSLIYPDKEVLGKAIVQRDLPSQTLALYSRYWQRLKLSF